MNEFSDNDFHNISKSIITEYIRSVLFIDDEWPEIEEDFTPDESHLVMDELPLESDIQDESEPPLGTMLQAHRSNDRSLLEFKKAVEEEGIIFHGLAYRHKKHKDIVAKLACRADVIVLDWELTADSGEETIHILKNLVKGGGLRFICIFTGKERIEDIKNQIDEAFSFMKIKDESPSEFRRDNLIIILRSKPKKITESSNHAVEPKNLLNQAINAFLKVYKGIVQLILLEMMNKHRESLPEVLVRIGSEIDPAFIAEGSDQDSPISRSDAFIEILMDEWRSQFRKTETAPFFEKTLRAYYSSFIGKKKIDKQKIISFDSIEKTKKILLKIVNWAETESAAFIDWLNNKSPFPMPVNEFDDREKKAIDEQRIAKLLFISGLIAPHNISQKDILNSALRLDVLFHQQSELPDKLTLGTILFLSEKHYLICTTPACDAERPEKINNTYCFISAAEVLTDRVIQRSSTEPYVVIEYDHTPIILKVDLQPYISLKISNPEIIGNDPIMACPWFPDNLQIPDHHLSLRPIAQLRADHALAISATAGAEATRVGVDRVEFIRSRLRKR